MSLLSLLAEAALCVIDMDRKQDISNTADDSSPRRASLASRSASCSPTHSHACSTTTTTMDRDPVAEPDWPHNKPQKPMSPKVGDVSVIPDNQQRHKHPSRRYQCEVCAKLFQRKHHLVSHLISHKNPDDKPFRCAIPGCDASFRRTQDMRRHMRKVFHKPIDLPQSESDFKIPIPVPGKLDPSVDHHHSAGPYSHSA
ncbi:hypothetical protein BJ741DRAFT_588930 [Chytriomyces cf. hyalinus JEL632]|nr:hypothetical protein BJ741DRAFT_588930 [Chytriomyces cf. hyalinus JEL632]